MCKRCGRWDQGLILGGLCGNCGDDLRQEAMAAEAEDEQWQLAQPGDYHNTDAF